MTITRDPGTETAPAVDLPAQALPVAPSAPPAADEPRARWWMPRRRERTPGGSAPRPPRDLPPLPALEPLPPAVGIARRGIVVTALLMLAVVVNVTVVSQLSYQVWQQQRYDAFREQLALAVAPVGEVDIDNRMLAPGAPVAYLDIPSIGLGTVIVEGSGAGETMFGPGHRRDTVLPGQSGTSVVYGRAAAYGGPFSQLERLAPGDTFTVTTGQGEHTYRVIGIRYAGDPGPPPPATGESRLVLVTARGPAFMPTGVVRLDAELTSTVSAAGPRVTVPASLPEAAQPMATDTGTVWALVLWLQALLLVEVAAIWCARRWGARQTWLVFSIVGLAVAFRVADEITKLLPNLL